MTAGQYPARKGPSTGLSRPRQISCSMSGLPGCGHTAPAKSAASELPNRGQHQNGSHQASTLQVLPHDTLESPTMTLRAVEKLQTGWPYGLVVGS
jgi:hypothetical protein